MNDHALLLVDGDARSLRVLEVSLRKAGYAVTTAASLAAALDALAAGAPDLIISETKFSDGDGYALCQRVRENPAWAPIPFMFLAAEASVDEKVRGLSLGVEDYLTKPIYMKEVLARVALQLQKRQRARSEPATKDGQTRFVGRLRDMPVVDVLQTVEVSRKAGVIQFLGERSQQASIYFRDGKVIDAEAGMLQGEDAVYRILTWKDGQFEVLFRTVRRRVAITTSSQGLLMEGMRRLDERERLLEELPPLGARLELDAEALAARLGDLPDGANPVLRLLDGRRTLLEVTELCELGDLECLQALAGLHRAGLLVEADRRDPGGAPAEPRSAGAGLLASLAATADEDVGAAPLLGKYRPSGLMQIDPSAVEASLAPEATQPEALAPEPDDDFAAFAEHDEGAEDAEDAEGAEHGDPGDGPSLLDASSPDPDEALDEGALAAEDAPSGTTGDQGDAVDAVDAVDAEAVHEDGTEAGVQDPPDAALDGAPLETDAVAEAPAGEGPPVVDEEVDAAFAPFEGGASDGVDDEEVDAAPRADEPPARPSPTRARRRRKRRGRAGAGLGAGPMLMIGLSSLLVALALYFRYRDHGGGSARGRARGAASAALDGEDGDGAVAPRRSAARREPDPAAEARPRRSAAKEREAPEGVLAPAEAPPRAADGAPDTAGRGATTGEPPAGAADGAPGAGSAAAGTPGRDRPDAPRPRAADAPAPEPAGDPLERARRLYDDARKALDAGDAARALALSDESLTLRRTARTYLVRAEALRRAGRAAEALEAVTAAEQLSPTFSPSWALAVRLHHAAGRTAEARAALDRYLQLAPTGRDADELRALLRRPR